ncbi:hypothetical protein [Streptomyces abyssomicinicus]|uniref:hypothetical protein n=1 Tax=Streptomyces abyssomicinicus TaxID=574929 RepID=UPI00124FE70A|nr:hypothetical protein [Streptomyces abyssomicinicus]
MLAETICSAVSAAGLGIAAVTAFRRRFLTAARIAAYSLVPLGLVLTGVVAWAADTAFSPKAWAGFGLLGGAWLLFLITRSVERRRLRRAEAPAADGQRRQPAATAAPERRSVGPAPETGRRAPAAGSGDQDDFSDIEAILKKHGI